MVHLGQRLADGKKVAIKLLHQQTDDHIRRFYREAKLLHRNIGNPYVVQLLDSNFTQGLSYIVMEYCAGGSLRDWVGKQVDWLQVVFALSNATAGLSGIHDAGGFHRDIKPDNLLVALKPDGSPLIKVGDFGLARVPHASSGPMTRTAWGTDGYIAPEVFAGSEFESACDVYSLGITGIELLTGTVKPLLLMKHQHLPVELRSTLLAMAGPLRAKRPTIARCQEIFGSIGAAEQNRRKLPHNHVDPQEPQPRPKAAAPAAEPRARLEARRRQEQAGPAAGAAVGVGLGGLALLIGGLALATMNPRDGNGRFRGRDGKFRSGRWG